MKELNAWMTASPKNRPPVRSAYSALHLRLQRAEAEILRLNRCVALKERQLCEMRKVLAHAATIHYSVEERLQRELDSLRTMRPAEVFPMRWQESGHDHTGAGVAVRLPYVTSIMSVLFDAMCTFWGDCDHAHPPKSSTVALAIDERLGLSSQPNGDASRSGQAYASAIRPDWVKGADNRHHYRSASGR